MVFKRMLEIVSFGFVKSSPEDMLFIDSRERGKLGRRGGRDGGKVRERERDID